MFNVFYILNSYIDGDILIKFILFVLFSIILFVLFDDEYDYFVLF